MLSSKLTGNEQKIKNFYLTFLKELRKQSRLGMDATNRFLVIYQSRVIQAADSKTSIAMRDERIKIAYNHLLKNGKILSLD